MSRLLISAIVVGVATVYPARATQTEPPWQQVMILRPAPVMGRWIEFNYSHRHVLPPYEKEPPQEGKEIARGLIPTVPPTPVLRDVIGGQLYVKEDHTPDFTTGPLGTYQSDCRDGVHVSFDGVRVFTKRESLTIPYTVYVSIYRSGYYGRLSVRSGWSGRFERAGASCMFTVIDNLDGQIDGEDLLVLSGGRETASRFSHQGPVPQVLFFDGHTYRLDFAFRSIAGAIVLEATATEIQVPLGEMTIEADGCRSLALRDDRQMLILTHPGGTVLVPAGCYRVDNCVLAGEPNSRRHVKFVGCDRAISIQPGQTTSLRVGLPLSNTVVATQDRNMLRLTYQLVGTGGEVYQSSGKGKVHHPAFRVYQGPLWISNGSFGWG